MLFCQDRAIHYQMDLFLQLRIPNTAPFDLHLLATQLHHCVLAMQYFCLLLLQIAWRNPLDLWQAQYHDVVTDP